MAWGLASRYAHTAMGASGKEPLLVVRDLSVAFGEGTGVEPVTRGVSFGLHAGQTLAVVGESEVVGDFVFLTTGDLVVLFPRQVK